MTFGNLRSLIRSDAPKKGLECKAFPLRFAAQPAVAADRFAREIGGFLAACAVRSRQLNGNPLGGASKLPNL